MQGASTGAFSAFCGNTDVVGVDVGRRKAEDHRFSDARATPFPQVR